MKGYENYKATRALLETAALTMLNQTKAIGESNGYDSNEFKDSFEKLSESGKILKDFYKRHKIYNFIYDLKSKRAG